MFFSPVVSNGLPIGAAGFLRSNGNLFNVAITRARAQLIVVGDRAACGACDIDYLSRFAIYTASLDQRSEEALDGQIQDCGPSYPVVANPESISDWERAFYIAAYRAGFRLVPQYPVEKYRVDFLMISDDRRLAIEIDGERYHRNWILRTSYLVGCLSGVSTHETLCRPAIQSLSDTVSKEIRVRPTYFRRCYKSSLCRSRFLATDGLMGGSPLYRLILPTTSVIARKWKCGSLPDST